MVIVVVWLPQYSLCPRCHSGPRRTRGCAHAVALVATATSTATATVATTNTTTTIIDYGAILTILPLY